MKNLKLARKLVLISIFLLSIILIFLYWFNQRNLIESTHIYDINSPSLGSKLLIVLQGSPFKESVTEGVWIHYKSTGVAVTIIDVATLNNTDVSDFDALLIIHRWEARAPAVAIQSFIDKNSGIKNKIVMLTTSWSGLEKMENINAITGASVMEDVPIHVAEIIERLDPMLKQKKLRQR